MKNYLNVNFIAVVVLVLAGALSPLTAQFQSDTQILRNYQSEYQGILNSIKTLESADDAQALMQRINQFNNEFQEHRDLINRFIYPEDMDGQIFNLRELTDAAGRNLQLLAQRDAEIAELNAQISDLTSRLDRFSARSDSLQQALERMTRDRNANAAMVRNLRAQLNEYDEFILGLVDSIFVAYDNLDLASLSPSERRELALRADRDNVVGHVGTVIENNIAFIDTHSQLSSVDLLRLKSTHSEFRDTWNNLGNKLADLYESERDREAKVSEVTEKIGTWGQRLDQALWRSLNASIEVRGIELESFNSPSSFYNALVNHIDNALERTAERGGSDAELETYENFASMWHNDIKSNWQEYLIDGDVLSYQNIATIDRKLTEWYAQSQPSGFNWLIIVGLLGLVVLVLIVILVTRSKAPAPAPAGA